MVRWLLAWGPVGVWVAVIIHWARAPYLRVLPLIQCWLVWLPAGLGPQVVEYLGDRAGELVLRKSGHVVVYFVLGLLLYRAVVRTGGLVGPAAGILVLALGLLVAASDEFFVQAKTPGRHPSLVDLGGDALGITLGALFWRFWGRSSSPGAP